MVLIEICAYILLVIVILRVWISTKFRYWKNKNVPFIKPIFPTGTILFKGKKINIGLLHQKYYQQMKGKGLFCGLFFYTKPAILVTDINFVKQVLVKDFQYFHDRGLYYNEKDDPLSAHLFNLEGEKWKVLRAKLTPTFTSGKMKYMFPTLLNIGHEFVSVLENEIKTSSLIEMKEFVARFTTDVIGSCAFGLECNSLKYSNSELRDMGRKILGQPRHSRIVYLFLTSFRKLGLWLHVKVTLDEVEEFFMKIIRDTVKYREENNVEKRDFMDLLLKLKNDNQEITLEELAAQSLVFFFAGFEPSSTTISYVLFELARNHKLQDKARNCVNEILSKHDDKMSYDAISEMEYIDHCINEGIRMYPTLPNLIRIVAKDYQVPNERVVLEKGTLVNVPVYAIHHDSEFYEDPERFMPERFEPENSTKRNPMTFIPFGEGPRNCIGSRFGLMQTRFALALLLKNFKFTLNNKTILPLEFVNDVPLLTTTSGIWLDVEPVNKI